MNWMAILAVDFCPRRIDHYATQATNATGGEGLVCRIADNKTRDEFIPSISTNKNTTVSDLRPKNASSPYFYPTKSPM